MSSSSATAPCSRSPSPATPESSDFLEPVSIQGGTDPLPWFQHVDHPKSLTDCAVWEPNANAYLSKTEEAHMLRLDDLIDENAYDASPPSPLMYTATKPPTTVPLVAEPIPSSFPGLSIHMTSLNGHVSLTKPIPPPASRPRKRDLSSANQRVVFPPKESCYNLPIMVPSIPEGGTKSRVETQVRVVVDLADTSSPSGDPLKYDRVGSWKWLKLPPGTATKKRTQKQGKIDPVAEDILHLSATVTCASPPYSRVLSCSSCQAREAKRVARKLAARVRPARSDSDSLDDTGPNRPRSKQEDTTSIIQFNCTEVLDFSTGSVVLPLRLTCYCRHHREKIGFNIHFSMMDHTGRIVGMGISRPIMITDDHKTTGNVHRSGELIPTGFTSSEIDWNLLGATGESTELHALSKRGQSFAKNANQKPRKRSKPYDSVRSNASRIPSPEASVASPASPATSPPITRSSTPPQCHNLLEARMQPPNQGSFGNRNSDPHLGSPSSSKGTSDVLDISIPELQRLNTTLTPNVLSSPLLSELHPSPLASSSVSGVLPHAIPFLFYNPCPPSSTSALPVPKIHRLIPACGPTHGGIEVTVLGTNFCPSISLNCVFGDVAAICTQRWSDNTLVCVLPPRAVPGVVAVWIEGFEKGDDNTSPCLFTYSDESDRALMELALQVVGLKMTGKIEDARNVAMRIVGDASDPSDSHNGMSTSDMMQVTSASVPSRDIRQLFFSRASASDDFESLIVRFLSVLDTPLDHHISLTSTPSALTQQTSNGQTLLHLAAFLGFSTLVAFLVGHDIDLDVRDRNGYTALHFTVLGRSRRSAELLVKAGADVEIVNVYGKTAKEEAPTDFFDGLLNGGDDSELLTEDSSVEDDEEAQWGDVEEEVEDNFVRVARRSSGRRTYRRMVDSMSKDDPVTRQDLPSIAAVPPTADTLGTGDSTMGPGVDEKQTASFVNMIQRALAQLHAPQGIIPNMPQLPLPGIPHLRGMPAVPWAVLPQIPIVFPVPVPISGWPSFLGEKRGGERGSEKGKTEGDMSTTGGGALRAAQELVMTWEKWMVEAATMMARTNGTAGAGAGAGEQQIEGEGEDAPPPVYTPRADDEGAIELSSSSSSYRPGQQDVEEEEECTASSSEGAGGAAGTSVLQVHYPERLTTRRVGYDEVPVPDQEFKAYGYQPKKSQKLQKKHDRMLLLFWLPILLLSLLWSFHNGIQFVYHAIKNALPLKTMVRS